MSGLAAAGRGGRERLPARSPSPKHKRPSSAHLPPGESVPPRLLSPPAFLFFFVFLRHVHVYVCHNSYCSTPFCVFHLHVAPRRENSGETGRRSSQRKPGCTDARHLGASGNLQCSKPRTRRMTSFEAAVVFHVSFLVSVIVERLEPPTRSCEFWKAGSPTFRFTLSEGKAVSDIGVAHREPSPSRRRVCAGTSLVLWF